MFLMLFLETGIATTDHFDVGEDEPEEDDSEPSASGSSDSDMPKSAKTSRHAPARHADFTAGSGLSDSLSTSVGKKQTVQTPLQLIPSEVGDNISSQSLLRRQRPKTAAEKKGRPPLKFPSVASLHLVCWRRQTDVV